MVLNSIASTIVSDFCFLGMYQKKKKNARVREVRHKITTCTAPVL